MVRTTHTTLGDPQRKIHTLLIIPTHVICGSISHSIRLVMSYVHWKEEISQTKKDGLQKFYNINDEDTLKFFTVHMHADKWHRKVVRNVIKKVADSKSKQDEITNSVESALGALNNFLTGMERVYC